MIFYGVYPHYINKAERKGRTKEELDKLVDELAKGKTLENIFRKQTIDL